jgi:hypothetical protein
MLVLINRPWIGTLPCNIPEAEWLLKTAGEPPLPGKMTPLLPDHFNQQGA